ncbi:MAG TPA: hypothetical protein V6D08_11615 [Candidatus Obscuribacterales bacterium]
MTQKRPEKRKRRQKRQTIEPSKSLSGVASPAVDGAAADPLGSEPEFVAFPGGPSPEVDGTAFSAFPGGQAQDTDEHLFPGAATAVPPGLAMPFPGSRTARLANSNIVFPTGSFPGGLNSVGSPFPIEPAGKRTRQSYSATVAEVQTEQTQDAEGAVTGGQTLVAGSKRKKRRNTSS